MRISDWSSDVCSSDLLPAVLINSPADATHYNLRIDNRGGVMLMVRHLLAGGRRNIVHLAGYSGNLDAAERAAAFREAMHMLAPELPAIGSASCRDRVCQYV